MNSDCICQITFFSSWFFNLISDIQKIRPAQIFKKCSASDVKLNQVLRSRIENLRGEKTLEHTDLLLCANRWTFWHYCVFSRAKKYKLTCDCCFLELDFFSENCKDGSFSHAGRVDRVVTRTWTIHNMHVYLRIHVDLQWLITLDSLPAVPHYYSPQVMLVYMPLPVQLQLLMYVLVCISVCALSAAQTGRVLG